MVGWGPVGDGGGAPAWALPPHGHDHEAGPSRVRTGRGPTVTVAASGSLHEGTADFPCPGQNDEAQIQRAIDAIAGGGTLQFSPGRFDVRKTLQVLNDNINLVGSGREATKLVVADGVRAVTFDGCFYGGLSDLTIMAVSAQTGGGGVYWIGDSYSLGLTRVRMENLYDDFTVNISLASPRAHTGWVRECVFWETVNHVATLQNFEGLTVADCVAWASANCVRGVYWTKGNGLWFTDNDFMRVGQAFVVNAATNDNAKWLFMHNVSLDTLNNYGVLITGAGNMQHYMLSNLHISNAGDHGIAIYSAANAKHIYIVNPRVFQAQSSGIYLSGIDDALVLGGEVCDSNQANSGVAANGQGIYVASCDSVRLIGVRSKNGEYSPAGNQKYGVYDGGSNTVLTVVDCDLTGNQTGGMFGGSGHLVRTNQGHVTENGGAAASVGDGGVIAHGLAAIPAYALVVPSVAGEMVGITARDGSQLTVAIKTHAGAAGSSQTVYWRAWV